MTRIATAFSGIGSPEMALRLLGYEHEVVFACEMDKFARQSYKAIYGIDEEKFYKDVYEIDGYKYRGHVDLFIGGSPCQAFSIAGMRNGVSDKRGELIYEYVRLVEEMKPTHFIYENVKGILSIDDGNTIRQFLQSLSQCGYEVTMDVLNSKNYGIPQNRERVFVIGRLLDYCQEN